MKSQILLCICSLAGLASLHAATTFGTYCTGQNNYDVSGLADHLNLAFTAKASSGFSGLKNSVSYTGEPTINYDTVADGTGNYWYSSNCYDINNAIGSISDYASVKQGFQFTLSAESGYSVSTNSITFDFALGSTRQVTDANMYVAYKLYYRTVGSTTWTVHNSSPIRLLSPTVINQGFESHSYTIDLSGIAALQDIEGQGVEIAIGLAMSPNGSTSRALALSNIALNGDVTALPVPEPATGILGMLGLATLACRRRRK